MYMSKIGFGFCKLLYSAMTNNVLSARYVIRELTWAIIWYLRLVLNLLPILVYHLLEMISSLFVMRVFYGRSTKCHLHYPLP